MKASAIIFIVLFLAGCDSSKKDQQKKEKALQVRLLKVHDRIMPEMETLVHNSQQLKAFISSLKVLKAKSPALDTLALSLKLKNSLAGLNAADHSMMDWMENLNLDVQNKTHDQIMAYLDAEYKSVTKVDLNVKSSIAESEKLITELKK